MEQTFYLKRGDTSPLLDFKLEPVLDLTDAMCVFNMIDAQGVRIVDAASASVPSPGTVRYAWRPQDVGTPGSYRAEFVVFYADGRRETFPNAGFISVIISPSAGATP